MLKAQLTPKGFSFRHSACHLATAHLAADKTPGVTVQHGIAESGIPGLKLWATSEEAKEAYIQKYDELAKRSLQIVNVGGLLRRKYVLRSVSTNDYLYEPAVAGLPIHFVQRREDATRYRTAYDAFVAAKAFGYIAYPPETG